MIEIIKQGTLPGDVPYECTCQHCKTHFRFIRSDALPTSDQRDGDYLSLACPFCERNCAVAVLQPPRPVKK